MRGLVDLERRLELEAKCFTDRQVRALKQVVVEMEELVVVWPLMVCFSMSTPFTRSSLCLDPLLLYCHWLHHSSDSYHLLCVVYNDFRSTYHGRGGHKAASKQLSDPIGFL
jgi:hypothetical protein